MPESIFIHFVHGSKPSREYRYTGEKVPGGLLGGHIYIQVAENVYGFESIDRKRIHIFPQRKFNSVFKKEYLGAWKVSTHDEMMTSIEIPVDELKLSHFKNILEIYCSKVPYDYAVLGMRCGSSSYQILSELGFFPVSSRMTAMLKVPVPRILRKKMLSIAHENNFRITKQSGSDKRIWEH
jgi:hypothetical protein